jgi:CRISPR-associated endonuclease/helicase Cas3
VFQRSDLVELRSIAASVRAKEIFTWGAPETVNGLLRAAFAHHGRPVHGEPAHARDWQISNTQMKAASGYDALHEAANIGEMLSLWFPAAFDGQSEPLPETARFHHLFCGLVALADWIGSTRSVFPFEAALDASYMERAREKATRAIGAIGLDGTAWRTSLPLPPAFSALGCAFPPRGGQAAIGDCTKDEALIILEAETGSGKTEAALWRFARLFQAGAVDGLYFAVPTRAAAKQLHSRVNKAMRHLFGPIAPEAVLAIPGYTRVGDHTGQALTDFRVLWDDRPNDEVQLTRWSAESARRFLAACVAVGTVDQAMLGALQIKHAHLRGAALSRSLLVIDEVHASDPYMTAVQSGLLEAHLAVGGHAMLMSATLGSAARERLLRGHRARMPDHASAVDTPYPALWSRNGRMGDIVPDPRSKEVDIQCIVGWSGEDAARAAVSMARKGARVLMIRNTVNAALAAFDAVRAMGEEALLWQVAGGPALHHARFAPEDRAMLDDSVEVALSKDPEIRPGGGVIVIGTQTLEQSLDICADALITDLCPADVLLQRIGRLHRHMLPRPSGFARAACMVLSPEGGLDRLAAPAFENGIGGFSDGGGVYRNLHACELTRRVIVAPPVWTIPAMNRLLVEGATHPERIEALNAEKGDVWQRYDMHIYGKDLADAQAGRGMRLPVDEPFLDLRFPEDDQKVRTRLGAEGARIPLAQGTPGPFGTPISSVTCPAHWRVMPPPDPVPAQPDGSGALLIDLGDRRLRYGRAGLQRSEA